MKLNIDIANLEEQFKNTVSELTLETGLSIAQNGFKIFSKEHKDGLLLRKKDGGIEICYSKKVEFFRGISHLSGLINDFADKTDGEILIEECAGFNDLTAMVDCARNAVLNRESRFKLIRLLSLMGYTALQFYTEDTFEIPGEPYFGHMRGRFSQEELRETDNYCEKFGIELVPCIQTLAHLNAIFKWPAYTPIRDYGDALCAGLEESYILIDKMFAAMRGAIKSRRINIGLDEAHTLGLGKYLDKFGYRSKSEILLEHLTRVSEIAKKYSFEPMMWSDMFFRMVSGGEYTGNIENFSKAYGGLKNKIPKDLTLIYWEYSSEDKDLYDNMLACHKVFDNEIAFAGSCHTYLGFAPFLKKGLRSTAVALESCLKNGVKNIIATMWGDNGKECSYFAALPEMLQYAEICYTHNTQAFDQPEHNYYLNKRLLAVAGVSFNDMLALELPNEVYDKEEFSNPCKFFLYNDLLNGSFDAYAKSDYVAKYAAAAQKLKELKKNAYEFKYLFDCQEKLCRVLEKKVCLGQEIKRAYVKNDNLKLKELASHIDGLIIDYKKYFEAFYFLWLKENKAFGLEVMQQRFGGLIERARYVKKQLLKGVLNPALLPLKEEGLPFDAQTPIAYQHFYSRICTAAILNWEE